MRTELRFLLAIGMMLIVLIGTNLLFPPVPPEETASPDSTSAVTQPEPSGGGADTMSATPPPAAAPSGAVTPSLPSAARPPADLAVEAAPERTVIVETPLQRLEFSNLGARLTSAELLRFQALNREGVVDLIPEGGDRYLSQRLVVSGDTVDLRRAPFRVEPEGGLRLAEGSDPQTLTFVYEHPSGAFTFEESYTFDPDRYEVDVQGRVTGLDPQLLLTDLGDGLAFTESDSVREVREMAYVRNSLEHGIQSTTMQRAEPGIVQGPLVWAAFRSKYFVEIMAAGAQSDVADNPEYLGGLIISPSTLAERVHIAAAQSVKPDGSFAYRLFLGPQDNARLSSLGQGMDEVNPYGWRFLRPILRPLVSVFTAVLLFLHNTLQVGYGWVLIVFTLIMRILLFPLTQKAMKAQLRNMSVQPLVQEIQKKYKDNPEKLQKEMMRLYKEHGFNPLAGCLPMLLPWPVLLSLFFVFRYTIELRGVPFLWLPDLSARDPLYVLPILLAVSMFATQFVSLRSLDQPNPQMKMMMWVMPGMMLFIFMNLASGLNLYYATSNLAMVPQQLWIANERKKMRGKPPRKVSRE